MTNWTYTLEKIGLEWHWELKDRPDAMWAVSDCAWTKRGAHRAMKRYIRREEKRKETRETGVL